MFKQIFIKIRNLFTKTTKYIFSKRKQINIFIFICIILSAAWYGFLFLVGNPPIATTPALIMVWVSVILLVISIFPKIFDKIKKVKIKVF